MFPSIQFNFESNGISLNLLDLTIYRGKIFFSSSGCLDFETNQKPVNTSMYIPYTSEYLSSIRNIKDRFYLEIKNTIIAKLSQKGKFFIVVVVGRLLFFIIRLTVNSSSSPTLHTEYLWSAHITYEHLTATRESAARTS